MLKFLDVVSFLLQSSSPAVIRDAEKLIGKHGAGAAAAAGVLASLEAYGLHPVATPAPGHWQAVKREIEARGFGRQVAQTTSASATRALSLQTT